MKEEFNTNVKPECIHYKKGETKWSTTGKCILLNFYPSVLGCWRCKHYKARPKKEGKTLKDFLK